MSPGSPPTRWPQISTLDKINCSWHSSSHFFTLKKRNCARDVTTFMGSLLRDMRQFTRKDDVDDTGSAVWKKKLRVSAIILGTVQVVWFAKCLRSILELNMGCQVRTSSTQLRNVQKLTTHVQSVQHYFFFKCANLWRSCRGRVSSLLTRVKGREHFSYLGQDTLHHIFLLQGSWTLGAWWSSGYCDLR